jgi:hypothetical protein
MVSRMEYVSIIHDELTILRVKLMGANFFEVLPVEKRDAAFKEVVGVLKDVCGRPDGSEWLGYVRLRAVARKR